MKKAIVFSLLLFGLVKISASIVLADSHLPRITTACESRNGRLFAFDDGFSFRKRCSGRNRRVVLIGEQGPKGDTGETGEQGLPGPKGDKGDPGTNSETKALKTFDANDTELGIYDIQIRFFFPELQRFVTINPATGEQANNGRAIYFLTNDCTGTAHIQVDNEGDMTFWASKVFSGKDGIYYILDSEAPITTVVMSTLIPNASDVCVNFSGSPHPPLRELTEVTYSLPDPVQLPLEFRYE